MGAGATIGPATVHDAGVGEPGGGGALHPGRPLLVQVGTLVSCRVVISIRVAGHTPSCCIHSAKKVTFESIKDCIFQKNKVFYTCCLISYKDNNVVDIKKLNKT